MATNLNVCPPEVIYLILEYADYATIARCREVSTTWRAIADKVMKKDVSWKKYFKDLGDDGKYLIRKSRLSWRQLFVNYILWKQFDKEMVLTATVDCKITKEKIRKIHIYKDKVIVVLQTRVWYLYIEKFALEKVYKGTYVDFNESDHMFLQFSPDSSLALYGKVNELSPINNDALLYQENIYMYILEDNVCYIMEKYGAIWSCEWKNNRWLKTYLARYFGSVAANNIQVSRNDIFIVLSNMDVFRVDIQSRQLVQSNTAFTNAQLYPYTSEMVGLTEAGDHLLLVSVGPRQIVASVVFVNHGDFFIILEKPGATIKIFSKSQMFLLEGKPRIKFNHDKYLVAVDVHEGPNCHHIIYATEDMIYNRKLHYPKAMSYINDLVQTGRVGIDEVEEVISLIDEMQNYLFTPLLNPSSQKEEAYNYAHIRTRNTVERCFGVWKARFRCLLTGVRTSLENTKLYIVALAVLHNIAIHLKEEDFTDDEDAIVPNPQSFPISQTTLRGNAV